MNFECNLTELLDNYLFQDFHILGLNTLPPTDLREVYVEYYDLCTALPQQYNILPHIYITLTSKTFF